MATPSPLSTLGNNPISLSVPLDITTQPFVPIRAAQALVKGACAVVPPNDLHACRNAIAWLLGMFGWFPLEFTPTGIRVDHGEAGRAVEQLIGFIKEIIAEYRPAGNKVFLMGFSQGTVMSYLTAFHAPELLHGVIACSGQLPEKTVPNDALKPALKKLPFLVMHGSFDDVLPIAKGLASKAWLEEHVEDFTWREYPIAHQIADSGIELMCSWLEERLPLPEKSK